MAKHKIGWCSMTFNPCWGCRNHCEYCYARAFAKRFWKQRYRDERNYYLKSYPSWFWTGDHLSGLKDFKPTFLESQFNKKFPQKTQKIFVGSMSEIAHWKRKWVVDVIHKIEQYPQHVFQFLTRYPEVYRKYIFPENCWLGITATTNQMLYNMNFNINIKRIKFISIEPILQGIATNLIEFLKIDWVIVGAETGNRKGKIIPEREWIEDIVNYCRENKIPIYLKDSLKSIYQEEIKEFPNGQLCRKV